MPPPPPQQNQPPGDAGQMWVFSTEAVPSHQRVDYWFGSVLSRLDPKAGQEEHRGLQGRLIRLSGDRGTDLICLSGNAIQAQRSLQRCRRDGLDDISIDFLVQGEGTTLGPAGAQRLNPGDMAVLDCAQPVAIQREDFRIISLFLPRAQVRDVAGDPALLAGRLLPAQGLAMLLRQHLLGTLGQAGNMQPAQRAVAIGAARDMALAMLHMQAANLAAPEHLDSGHYHAALVVIARHCTNPALSPLQIANAIGCSRATLYRAFGKHGETVGAAISRLRLAHAARLLRAPGEAGLISNISYQSGFTDHASFTRMFKRAFGITPREMRQGAAPRAG